MGFLQDLLQKNQPVHLHKCAAVFMQQHFVDCGVIYHLCRFLRALIISFLPDFAHSSRHLCFTSCPARFCPLHFFFFGRSPLPSSALSSSPLAGRQLRIIKWWIRGYFLPTQTCGGWAGILALDFIPLSSRKASKSHCCPPSPPSRKTVESPLIPCVSSTPGSTRPGCCREKFLL